MLIEGVLRKIIGSRVSQHRDRSHPMQLARQSVDAARADGVVVTGNCLVSRSRRCVDLVCWQA